MPLPDPSVYQSAYGQPAWGAPVRAGSAFMRAMKEAQDAEAARAMQAQQLDRQARQDQLAESQLVNKDYQFEREMALKEKELAGRRGEAGLSPEDAFKRENALRDEYSQKSKSFAEQVGALGRIEKSAKTPSAAGDLALIFSYMKMLDPGSTVREGEFANAQNAAGWTDQARNLYNRAISGQRLNPDQRRDFYQSARRTFAGALGTQGQTRKGYQELATRYGVNPQNVLLDSADPKWFEEGGFNPEDISALGQDGPPPPPKVPGVRSITKVK